MSAIALQLAALSIASTDYDVVTDSARLILESDTVRNDAVVDSVQSEQIMKLRSRIEASLMSDLTAPDRVSHLNLTVASLDGTDILALGVDNLNLAVSYGQQMRPNAGSIYDHPLNTNIRCEGSARVTAPATAVLPFFNDMGSSTHGDHVMVYSFTINSINIQLPVLLTGASVAYERDGLQIVDLTFGPRKPTSGAYPVAPTGTTTLLEKALNAYRTAVAVVADTGTAGTRVSGNYIFDSMNIEVQDGALIPISYVFKNQGSFSVATISS